jgi:hypothetical protein
MQPMTLACLDVQTVQRAEDVTGACRVLLAPEVPDRPVDGTDVTAPDPLESGAKALNHGGAAMAPPESASNSAIPRSSWRRTSRRLTNSLGASRPVRTGQAPLGGIPGAHSGT